VSSRAIAAFASVLCCAAAPTACRSTTGGDIVTFRAALAGPEDAPAGSGPLAFRTRRGFDVELRVARLYVGAIYVNQSVPSSGSDDAHCILHGTYVGQAFGPVEVDLLSSTPTELAAEGEGTTYPAKAGGVWLGDDRPFDEGTAPKVLELRGTASRDGQSYPFEAIVSIGRNRLSVSANPALPGQNPICGQRIVSPIPVSLTLTRGGRLLVRVDPRNMLANVDFSALLPALDTPNLYRFRDETSGPAEIALYDGLRAKSGTYLFEWRNK